MKTETLPFGAHESCDEAEFTELVKELETFIDNWKAQFKTLPPQKGPSQQ